MMFHPCGHHLRQPLPNIIRKNVSGRGLISFLESDEEFD